MPVRVAGGLLFELLGQSAGDPFIQEDDIPIVLRSWQAQNFLVTALHVKGFALNISVLGITEVQVCSSYLNHCFPLLVDQLVKTGFQSSGVPSVLPGNAYCWWSLHSENRS